MNDLNVWKALPAHDDGFVPHVKRQYLLANSRVQIELVSRHPSLDGYYSCRGVFAHQVSFTPEWVKLERDIVPL